jgi:hypothetical protein
LNNGLLKLRKAYSMQEVIPPLSELFLHMSVSNKKESE